jgi:hypothetical protein
VSGEPQEEADQGSASFGERHAWFGPFVSSTLSNAAGTLLAAVVIFLVGLVAGFLDDVPIEVVLGSIGTLAAAAAAAVAAVSVSNAAETRAEAERLAAAATWERDREAVSSVSEALSEYVAPQLSKEQLDALSRIKLSDEQFDSMKKAAELAGTFRIPDDQLRKLQGLTPVKLTDEQQKALQTLSRGMLSDEAREKLADLSLQLSKTPKFTDETSGE